MTPPLDDIDVLAAAARLATLSRTQRIASILMLHVPGTNAADVRAFTTAHQPGGLILMPDNVGDGPDDLASLTRAVSSDDAFPVLLGIDQEGGLVRRIRSDEFASSVTLKHDSPETTRRAFESRSRMLAEAGFAINFGIVADVTADENAFMFGRALGCTPQAAAERVHAAVVGETGHVLSTLKHFPGHGRTIGDSHSSIPDTDVDVETWARTDAVPFDAGIRAGAELVMVGHLRYSAVDDRPASLSAVWHRILRERLGFGGVIITDDLLMLRDSGVPDVADASENAIRAIDAGSTMLLVVFRGDPALEGTDPQTLIAGIDAAVDAGRISDAQIDRAALTLLTLRHRTGRRSASTPGR